MKQRNSCLFKLYGNHHCPSICQPLWKKTALSIILIHLGDLHCLSYAEERKLEKKTRFYFGQVVTICNTGTLLLCIVLCVVNVHISRVSQLSEMGFTAIRCGTAEFCLCAHLYCTLHGWPGHPWWHESLPVHFSSYRHPIELDYKIDYKTMD